MVYLVNFIYDLTNSDALYYILILLLVIISVVMIYLMYSQNKEIAKQLSNKKIVEENNVDTKVAFKEIESLDNREELLELSKKTIPKPLEYTQTLFSNTELQELQDITKELEENYRDRQSDINVYEEEQEESAIISYEELLSKTQKLPKIVEEDIISNSSNKDIKYIHEENFLNKLKNLNNNLK